MSLLRLSLALGAGLFLLASGPLATLAANRTPAYEASIVSATGKPIGNARFVAVAGGGTQIHIVVAELPPGQHGMHVHAVGSCNDRRDTAGAATKFGEAGPHFDPMVTMSHKGPDAAGHAGDLPNLVVDPSGNGSLTYYASGLQTAGAQTIVGRAIVIHANVDNYTDVPENGGSGGRIACGEIGASVVK